MDKDKAEQLRRVFKRILMNVVREVHEDKGADVEAIMVNQTGYELLKEVTIRTKIA